MSRAVVVALALVSLPLCPPDALAVESVRVTNFPRQVSVRGAVTLAEPATVEGTLDATRLVTLRPKVVPPDPPSASPDDVHRMTALGRVDADGFTSALISIVGTFDGQRPKEGELTLILLPDVSPVRTAQEDDHVLLLAERVSIPLTEGPGSWIAGAAPRLDLRFPRYRAWFSNTGRQSIRATAYLQLQQ